MTMSYQINKVIFLYKVRIYVFFKKNYKKDQSYLWLFCLKKKKKLHQTWGTRRKRHFLRSNWSSQKSRPTFSTSNLAAKNREYSPIPHCCEISDFPNTPIYISTFPNTSLSQFFFLVVLVTTFKT